MADGTTQISTVDGKVSAWIIPTDEEYMIASHTLTLLEH